MTVQLIFVVIYGSTDLRGTLHSCVFLKAELCPGQEDEKKILQITQRGLKKPPFEQPRMIK
jgi:hypothetical protein